MSKNMNYWDFFLTGAIIIGAVWFLYRTFVVKKGCTCGTSCCSGANSTSMKEAKHSEEQVVTDEQDEKS